MGETQSMISKESALPGRSKPAYKVSNKHSALGTRMQPPFPSDTEMIVFAMGCFWGAERKFWQMKNVYSTQVGYVAGFTPNPTYKEICSGQTGHTEAVRVVYNPNLLHIDDLLKVFWENHDPTQGMRQGNDMGTQYRSGIYYYTDEQRSLAEISKQIYQSALVAKGYSTITTEILPAEEFYYAEDYHQQYLHKNPNGYCGMGGTGARCDVSLFHSKPSSKNQSPLDTPSVDANAKQDL